MRERFPGVPAFKSRDVYRWVFKVR